ncbi:MAG TPA: Crp/Fnr family transcriptional regulator [Micromonosporaceae bacterium]|nr:Crp/Fnr family transcriptional regulator [Micromonosporaceae bacterium]
MGAQPWPEQWPAGTFLAGLSVADTDALLGAGTARAFVDRQVIIAEGVGGAEVYLIVRGFAKVVTSTPGGAEALLAVRAAGDILGELAAVDGGGRASTAIAAGPVQARMVDAPRFNQLLDERPGIGRAVRLALSAKLREASHFRVDAGPAGTRERVVRALVHLMDIYGRPVDGGGLLVGVPLSQADLAKLVGISVPSTTRALRTLRDEAVLDTAYRRIVVRDPDRLRAIALEER